MATTAKTEDSSHWNFASTPGMLPPPVRQQLAMEFAADSFCTPLETYHRSKAFAELHESLLAKLRRLCALPEHCRLLLLQGGASMQFFMLPLNICRVGAKALYLGNGYWSGRAAVAATSLGIDVCKHNLGPDPSLPINLAGLGSLRYVFYVDNETADGIEFPCCPVAGRNDLVADMSSNFMTRPFCFDGHAAIFAGAQKNLGIAGLTVVLLDGNRSWSVAENMPQFLDCSVQMKAGSLYNTPVLMSWYVASLVLDWIEAQGGLDEMARRNQAKSQLLYSVLDASSFYQNRVAKTMRSRMNATFCLDDAQLLPSFLAQAEAAGLHGLAGHRHLGGLRAALYNAMPLCGVEALVAFMQEFERRYG